MSRTGKQPVLIPDKVKVRLDGRSLFVEGPLGKEQVSLHSQVNVEIVEKKILVTRKDNQLVAREAHGLMRSLIKNAVKGTSEGFTRELEINGVGYRADVQGKNLNLTLGFSHPINYLIPEGVKIAVDKQTRLTISGSNKETLGRVASQIRSFRPPEPYKGKGVKYVEEVIQRKVGKAAGAK